MKKYFVTVKSVIYWEGEVEAENESEAEDIGITNAWTGNGDTTNDITTDEIK